MKVPARQLLLGIALFATAVTVVHAQATTQSATVVPTTGVAAGSVPFESIRDAALRDQQRYSERFIALADAFPEAIYDYRPQPGVRSTREVLLLIIAENYGMAIPVPFSSAPAEFADGAAGLARLNALRDKQEILRHLRASFAAFRSGLQVFPVERISAVAFFGPPRPINYMLTGYAGDQHEHLGQLIAYARMNGITPPWSK